MGVGQLGMSTSAANRERPGYDLMIGKWYSENEDSVVAEIGWRKLGASTLANVDWMRMYTVKDR
jgi:hypothetical protein